MKRKAFKAAFPYTIPIMAGFGFLGLAYGIYMNSAGFSFLYPFVMSIIIFGGAMQFVAVSMLTAPYAPLQTFIMVLLVQARHLFYSISMLDKFRGTGWKKFYLIFGMCDETFSINYTVDIPEDVDRGWFMFFVTLLDHSYWIIGSTIGGIVGSLISFSTDGISFVMTAVFVVIFINQWEKESNHTSAFLGLAVAEICLIVFGADSFMVPTMIGIIVLLTALRRPLERMERASESESNHTEVAKQ